jgi:hypothetical protein
MCPRRWRWSGGRVDGRRPRYRDEPRRQTQAIANGLVAALKIIKHLGTNGGGFFKVNGAHPFDERIKVVLASVPSPIE